MSKKEDSNQFVTAEKIHSCTEICVQYPAAENKNIWSTLYYEGMRFKKKVQWVSRSSTMKTNQLIHKTLQMTTLFT